MNRRNPFVLPSWFWTAGCLCLAGCMSAGRRESAAVAAARKAEKERQTASARHDSPEQPDAGPERREEPSSLQQRRLEAIRRHRVAKTSLQTPAEIEKIDFDESEAILLPVPMGSPDAAMVGPMDGPVPPGMAPLPPGPPMGPPVASSPNPKKQSRKHKRDLGYNNPHVPRELRMSSHPIYVIEPPDVLYIEALDLLPNRPVAGERLVRQDGTISLGYYGQIHVSGLTIPEIEEKIRERLRDYVNDPQVYVDVAAFNSKVYYVVGQVQQAGRLPITGKETVLDALSLSGGPTNYAKLKDVHVARPNPGGGCDQILWVDYYAITYAGDTRTNYQLLPGDRVMVPATKGFMTSVFFDNVLPPFERLAALGALLRFSFGNFNNN